MKKYKNLKIGDILEMKEKRYGTLVKGDVGKIIQERRIITEDKSYPDRFKAIFYHWHPRLKKFSKVIYSILDVPKEEWGSYYKYDIPVDGKKKFELSIQKRVEHEI